jgi:hypothetical protein
MDQIESLVHPMNQWETRRAVKQRTPTYRISPICFHLNRLESGKDNTSSEAYLQSLITKKGFNLHLELSIFVKIFKLYLVIQCL